MYTEDAAGVNKKSAILTLNSNDEPIVSFDDKHLKLQNTEWSRWYLRTHFAHLQADGRAREWYMQFDPTHLEPIHGLLTQPWTHQRLAANRMWMSNCALWLDMGLGKTGLCILNSLRMRQHGLGDTFLTLCPPSVFVTWEDEIAKHIDPALKPKIFLAHGPKKDAALASLRADDSNSPKFILSTYETLENIRETLQTIRIAAAYLDESSKVKNWEAKRTQSLHRFLRSMPTMRRFLLSGTPSTKNCLGFYSQYEALGKGFSGQPSYLAFEKRYAVNKLFMTVRLPHGRITSLDVDNGEESMSHWLAEHYPPNSHESYLSLGYEFSKNPRQRNQIKILNYHKRNIRFVNQEELHAVTQTHAYTVYKDEVFKDLPPKSYVKRVLEMTDEQKKAYRELVENSRTEINKIPFSFDRSSPFAKLHQIANGYIVDQNHEAHFFKQQPKLDELRQIFEEVGRQKVMIWSPFRPQIAQLSEFLKKEIGIDAIELHGGVNIEDRKHAVHAFQDEKGAQAMVCNPAVGGLGLNLTCAALEIFVTNWFTPDVRKQAEDRLHRPGQTRAVTVLDLVMKGSLEVALLRSMRNEIDMERRTITMSVLLGKEQ